MGLLLSVLRLAGGLLRFGGSYRVAAIIGLVVSFGYVLLSGGRAFAVPPGPRPDIYVYSHGGTDWFPYGLAVAFGIAVSVGLVIAVVYGRRAWDSNRGSEVR